MTTDYQIKKELENEIYNCEYNARPYAYIGRELLENTVDLINRQQAEIAKLEEYIDRCKSGEEYWVKCLIERPNEAVKEFAERLKDDFSDCHVVSDGEYAGYDREDVMHYIDALVKEMAGYTE